MTAVTGPATATDTGWPLSDSGPQASQDGPPQARSALAARPVPPPAAATPATPGQGGTPAVPATRPPYLRAVPAPAPAAIPRATLGHLSSQVAPAKRDAGRDSSGQGNQGGRHTGGSSSEPARRPPVSGPASSRREPVPDHRAPLSASGEPAFATAVQGRPESAVFAYVDGLDGAERKVLLNHIVQAWPEVVEAGVELVAQWRAECAEHRQEAAKLKRREQRRRERRRAAELGDG